MSMPIFCSVFRPEALTESVLAHYTLDNDPHCYLYTRGINDVYIVHNSQGAKRWVLRITAANGHTPAAVQSEIDMLRHLAASGIPVVAPISRRDGRDITLLSAPEGERPAVLFDYIDHTPAAPTPDQARRYGITLARMHAAAATYPGDLNRPPHDAHYFVHIPLQRLANFPLFPQDTLARLRAAAAGFWNRAAQLPTVPPYYGFCHGDSMSGNALYGPDDRVTLIDFDYGGLGWRIYDLATYIWALIINGPQLDWSRQDLFRALLDGYQSVRPLLPAEYAALPAFAGLRQLFLFGMVVKNAAAFGTAWLTPDWLSRMLDFIAACQNPTMWLPLFPAN